MADGAIGAPRIGLRRDTKPKAKKEPVDLEATAKAYQRQIKWKLTITGEHYSGLSNQALLEVRQKEGRDFAHETPALRAAAAKALYAEVRTWKRWSEVRADGVWSEAALEWIIKRVQRGGVDVTLKPLSPAYAKWKQKRAPGRPIGVLTRKWFDALVRNGRVRIE